MVCSSLSVVPNKPLKKAGKTLLTDYAKQHFSQYYENTQVNLNVINAGDLIAEKAYSRHLVEFIEGDRLNSSTIQVLLINAGMLNSTSMKKDYAQTLLSGWTSP